MVSDPLPSVTVHFAQSVDGRIATREGQSRWISSAATLRYAHSLRAKNQAVLVGAGTIRVDDPSLTVRLAPGPSPLRVVLDSRLSIPTRARILNDDAVSSTLILTTAEASPDRIFELRAMKAQVAVVKHDHGQVDLHDALTCLAERGIHSVLVEGGARVITAFLKARLVKQLSVCIAPLIIGEGLSAVGNLGTVALDEALRFQSVSWRQVGHDVVMEAKL